MSKKSKLRAEQFKWLHAQFRVHGVKGAVSGCSLYDLAALALLPKMGHQKIKDESNRAFVLRVAAQCVAAPISAALKRKTKRELKAVLSPPIVDKPITASDKFIASKEFLESYDWRKLRMQALKLHGARCQCCGITPKDGAVMNVDHIKPRKTHPQLALSLSNLQILCNPCNHGKGNWDSTDWRS